ncbi:MAG: GLUG motif-containing protein [Bacteroidota bacterium]
MMLRKIFKPQYLLRSGKKSPIGLGLLMACLLVGCTKPDPFYPLSGERLEIVAVQINGVGLEDGKEGVKVDDAFTVIFSVPVDPNQAESAFSLTGPGGPASVIVSFNDNQSIMAISPGDSLAYEADYTLNIQAGSFGQKGESLGENFRLAFRTEIEPKPLFAGGTGTAQDPYQVATAEQFDLIRLFLTDHFIVVADIDLSGYPEGEAAGWVPIGVLGESFEGKLDGGDHVISGLNIQRPDQNEVGLFGVIDGAGEIRNLVVQTTGIAGAQATGALVGRQMNGSIVNCHASGSITGTSSRIGGLVGSQQAGLIDRCSSSCGVFADLSRVGGLVGLTDMGTIQQSFASGNCESLSSRAGGLVGSVESDASVFDCYATGNVTGRNRAGGLFGRLDGTAARGYATGKVTVTDADDSGDYAGHVVGQLGSSAGFSSFFYPTDQIIAYGGNADITEDGVKITTASISCAGVASQFPGLDFASVWSCVSDGSWLALSWQ